jgi:hypothetical protein
VTLRTTAYGFTSFETEPLGEQCVDAKLAIRGLTVAPMIGSPYRSTQRPRLRQASCGRPPRVISDNYFCRSCCLT